MDEPASPALAAGALIQSLIVDTDPEPAAPSLRSLRNASLAVAGDSPASVPSTPLGWAELLLPVEGPEVWRSAPLPSGSSPKGAVAWVHEWANNWVAPPPGGKSPYSLTTKVVVRPTDTGARLLFNPKPPGGGYAKERKDNEKDGGDEGKGGGARKSSQVGLEGGVEVVVDAPLDGSGGGLRVRAKRCAYGDGATVKEMSEESILRRLKDDVARFVKNANL